MTKIYSGKITLKLHPEMEAESEADFKEKVRESYKQEYGDNFDIYDEEFSNIHSYEKDEEHK
jgi:hypothetical protein